MQEINPIKRAKSLIKDMNEEIKSVEIDNEIEELVDDSYWPIPTYVDLLFGI